LFHVGAREYDPRTARWLQRDPIDVAGGDPNLYRYCFNRPVTWKDPSGLEIVIFVHGSNSGPGVFVEEKGFMGAVKQTLGAKGHVLFKWSGTEWYFHMKADAADFCSFVHGVKAKHPFEPIYVVAHSNGGNVATLAAKNGAPIDLIVRIASPTPDPKRYSDYTNVPMSTMVYNFYDPDDSVVEYYAPIGRQATTKRPSKPNWCNIEIEAGEPGRFSGINVHSNALSEPVWNSEIAPYLKWIGDWNRFLGGN
jgi:pimeloyl-ACP methyl ester carboxylesterase